MNHDNSVGKSIYNALAVTLAIVIIILLICFGLLMFVFNGKGGSEMNQTKQTTLKVLAPSKSELKISDSISISAEGYVKKGTKKQEIKQEEKEEEKEEEANLSGDYICPASNSRLLTDADIAGLSAQELNYAKNEIYARHGRKFDSPELQKYFESKSWYTGIYDGRDFDSNYSSSLLSDIEKKNAEILRAAENKKNSGGYDLN